jgi:uncharacterized glyoxalase superfamily protein PhnB
MSKVKAKPEGFHTVTPQIIVRGAEAAIDFYRRAFSAEERYRMTGPDGRLLHAEICIGDSIVMLADELPEMGSTSPATLSGTAGSLMLYVDDCDVAFKRAIEAGATSAMPPQDMFWGDRYGRLVDPFGHHWAIATRKEDLSPEEIGKRQDAFFQTMKK